MRTRIMVIAGLFLLCAAALATQQSAGELLFRRCRDKDMLDDDKRGAIPLCEQVVTGFPADIPLQAKARTELGHLYEDLGDLGKARGHYAAVCKMTGQPLATDACSRLPDPNAPIKIVTPFTEDPYSFAISPNGETLVYQATVDGKSHLWIQPVKDGSKGAPIAGTENAKKSAFPFFSPDGKSIGFFAEQKLKRIDLVTGVVKILTEATSPMGGAWSGDVIIFNGQGLGSGVMRIPADGGPVTVAATYRPNGQLAVSPRFLPDGNHFLYFGQMLTGGNVFLGALDQGKEALRLPAAITNAQNALFAPPDRLLWVAGSALRSQPVKAGTLEPTGPAIVVADRVGREARYPGRAAVYASNVGPVAYRTDVTVESQMIWMDRSGRQTGTLGSPDRQSPSHTRLSPDGRYVIYYRTASAAVGSIWLIPTTEGAPRQLMDSTEGAVWSPDGESLALSRLQDNGPHLFELILNRLRGEGTWFKAATNDIAWPDDWSRKGFLLYEHLNAGNRELKALPVNGGNPIPVADAPARQRDGRFSPDGNWVAYESNEVGGQDEVYVQPFPGSKQARIKVSVNGGTTPQWGLDGKELYFLAPDYRVMVVSVTLPANGQSAPQFSAPAALFRLRQGSEFEATPDGSRFLVISPLEDAPPIYVLPDVTHARPQPTPAPVATTAPAFGNR